MPKVPVDRAQWGMERSRHDDLLAERLGDPHGVRALDVRRAVMAVLFATLIPTKLGSVQTVEVSAYGPPVTWALVSVALGDMPAAVRFSGPVPRLRNVSATAAFAAAARFMPSDTCARIV